MMSQEIVTKTKEKAQKQLKSYDHFQCSLR